MKKVQVQKTPIRRARKITGILLLILVGVMVIHSMIAALSAYLYPDIWSSFPWYSAFYFIPLIYYALPIVILTVAYLLILIISRKNNT